MLVTSPGEMVDKIDQPIFQASIVQAKDDVAHVYAGGRAILYNHGAHNLIAQSIDNNKQVFCNTQQIIWLNGMGESL